MSTTCQRQSGRGAARSLLTSNVFLASCSPISQPSALALQAAMNDQRGPARMALHDEAPDADLDFPPIVQFELRARRTLRIGQNAETSLDPSLSPSHGVNLKHRDFVLHPGLLRPSDQEGTF